MESSGPEGPWTAVNVVYLPGQGSGSVGNHQRGQQHRSATWSRLRDTPFCRNGFFGVRRPYRSLGSGRKLAGRRVPDGVVAIPSDFDVAPTDEHTAMTLRSAPGPVGKGGIDIAVGAWMGFFICASHLLGNARNGGVAFTAGECLS